MRIASFSDAGLTKACASALQPRSTAAARHMRCWTAAAPVAVTRHKAALAAMRRRVRGILEIKWVRPGRPGVVQLAAALAGAQFRTCLARARQRSKFSAVRRSRREREEGNSRASCCVLQAVAHERDRAYAVFTSAASAPLDRKRSWRRR